MARGFEVTTGLVIMQGIFEESVSAKHKIGTRMQLADGRVFYYAQAGGTIIAGNLCLAVLPTASFDQCALDTAGVVGSKTIGITPAGSPTVLANDFAEGYFVVHGGTTGGGQCRKISSHDASSSNSEITLELYDPFTAVVHADAVGEIIRNPYKDVTHLANSTGTAVGVPLIAMTDNYFGWLQTWGECALLAGGDGDISSRLIVNTTAGEVLSLSIDTEAKYNGYPMHVGKNLSVTMDDASYHATFLEIRP
jgi:hypothetical protein